MAAKRRKPIVPIIILAIVVTLSVIQYNQNRRVHYADRVFGSGIVEAEEINVSSKTIGRIVDLRVAEGQQVAAGQLIAKLDDLDIASRDLARAEKLYAQQAIPAEQYEKLQKNWGNYLIYAPISGTVILQSLRQGELITPGQPLVTLADMKNLYTKVYVAEDDIGEIHLGSTADLFVDAFPNKAFHGTVSYISAQAEFIPKNIQTKDDRVNLVFAVKIAVKNPDGKLKLGMPVDTWVFKKK
jgi:HlyD family secretion protein